MDVISEVTPERDGPPLLSRPAATPERVPEPAPRPVLLAALGVVSLAGAGLMFYGNGQNSTRGAGPVAAIVGTVIVATIAALICGAAIAHSMRVRAASERSPRLQVSCTTCGAPLPYPRNSVSDSDAIVQAVRRHERDAHPPYDPTILRVFEVKVALVSAGTLALPTEIRRYRLSAPE